MRFGARLKNTPLTQAQRHEILNSVADAQAQLHAQHAWASEVVRAHQVPHRAEWGECGRVRDVHLQPVFSRGLAGARMVGTDGLAHAFARGVG